jgi:hypothetical protein
LSGNDGNGVPYKQEIWDFNAVDRNVGGSSVEYKICICRTNSNSFSVQPGTFVNFDTYDLFDLTD